MPAAPWPPLTARRRWGVAAQGNKGPCPPPPGVLGGKIRAPDTGLGSGRAPAAPSIKQMHWLSRQRPSVQAAQGLPSPVLENPTLCSSYFKKGSVLRALQTLHQSVVYGSVTTEQLSLL